jgi:hypothetical protein
VRWAFTDEELRKLVAGSEDRGIIYFTAARTGLRQEELKQMKWGDLHLDADVPFVVVRDYAAKNKKEESVQLVPEIVEALTAHRPAGCVGTDLVFPHGIPRARCLTLDAEANGIPYRDELGRYGDFHALRYTWATFLQRNGVAQRFAMKLMRHSDIRLTAQVYTDEMQLPIYDVSARRNQEPAAFGCGAGLYTNTRTDFRREWSNRVATWREKRRVEPHRNPCKQGDLSRSVTTCHKLSNGAGEPAFAEATAGSGNRTLVPGSPDT